MLLTGRQFLVFLIPLYFAYVIVAKRPGWRVVFLALFSYFIYASAALVSGTNPTAAAWSGAGALGTLFAISTVDFLVARLIVKHPAKREILLAVSLFVSFGTLCFTKYSVFLIDSINRFLTPTGVAIPTIAFHIAAPLGISFFALQSASYVIDVYRGDIEPAGTYLDYLAFVSFFPTIIAGPILRARQLLPQLRGRFHLDQQAGSRALLLIAVGLIKKFAVADYLSANFVDRVFDFPERFSSVEVLLAIYAYAIQIYADFSGYSDIAIGSALLLGFEIPVNFNSPYRSRSLPEFWRRWHISLSTWLRDYVFFSMAGKRSRSKLILYAGLVVTMLIGGLWHGASWTFVLWGLLHGLGLAAVRGFGELKKGAAGRFVSRFSNRTGRFVPVLSTLVTFNFVCLTWVFFRAESTSQAVGMLRQLSRLTVNTANLTIPVAIVLALGYIGHWTPEGLMNSARKWFDYLPAPAQAGMLFALAIGLYYVSSSDVAPFIYTRF